MKILILNTSPKKKGGASKFFSAVLKPLLLGCEVVTYGIHNQSNYKKAFELMKNMDAVIISGPLYVDGIASHMLQFLQEAEKVCRQSEYKFKLYVLSNSGFIEGIQNKLQLNMYEAWCERSGIEWGGGLGIGGGECMYIVALFVPISFFIRSIILGMEVMQTEFITFQMIWDHYSGMLINVFFLLGLIICDLRFAYVIRKGKHMKNLFTRPIMPSIVFLIAADIIMFASCLFSGGRPNTLFKKIRLDEAVEYTFKPH